MKSFAVLAEDDARLLRHMGHVMRLRESSEPAIDGRAAVVAHRGEARVTREGSLWIAGSIRLDERAFPELTDEEEVLRAWRRRGLGFVEELRGDYSFVLGDDATGALVGVRDRFGIRPFYYAVTERGVVASDTLHALLVHPGVNAEALDDGAVAAYLANGVADDPEATVFAQIRRLPPAHLLVDGKPRRYWQPQPQERRADARARFEAALIAAIRDRVRGDDAVVFMSGGLDSTTLAALTRETLPHVRLRAGTSVYRTRIADVEERYAAEAARSIGIEQELFILDDYAPLASLEGGLWCPDPGPLLALAMTRDIYARSARLAPIALHGHLADALLIPDHTSWLRSLLRTGQWPRFASALLQYTRLRRRPPYFLLRASRGSSAVAALSGAGWASYFEWAHPLMTGAAIELVYPYADLRVIEAALALAPIPWLVEKRVLREVLRGRISETIRHRRKTPLQGNPWTMQRPDGELGDDMLRALAFDYWRRELPSRVEALRRLY